MSVIEVDGLEKTYPGGIQALKGISISVEKGEVYGLLGPNGAGKTTTVRILNGTLKPDRGTFSVLGLDTADEALRKSTATMSENAKMYETLSIEENLRFFASMYGMNDNDANKRMEELLTRMQLWDRRADILGTLSTGLKKRVQLARTLLHSPQLLFLDEPTSGLDPDSARQVNSLIRTLADDSLVRITTTAGKTLEEHIENPSRINPLLSRLIDEGTGISEVVRPKPSLEDAYFHYIGRSSHELV